MTLSGKILAKISVSYSTRASSCRCLLCSKETSSIHISRLVIYFLLAAKYFSLLNAAVCVVVSPIDLRLSYQGNILMLSEGRASVDDRFMLRDGMSLSVCSSKHDCVVSPF